MLSEDPRLLAKLRNQGGGELCMFQLTHPTKISYTFAAQDETDLVEWINALNSEMFREFVVVHDAVVQLFTTPAKLLQLLLILSILFLAP